MLTSALLVDFAIGASAHPRANPATTFAWRRLDDLAYGAGLWIGCSRLRSPAAENPLGLAKPPTNRAVPQRHWHNSTEPCYSFTLNFLTPSRNP